MKLNKAKAIELHRELWDWLAKNPSADKEDWPGWDDYPQIDSLCFLCVYDKQEKGNKRSCSACPVRFNILPDMPPGIVPYCLGGLFSKWANAASKTSEEADRALLAAVIRDLPVRFEAGDRVIPTMPYGNPNILGKIGTVFETTTQVNGGILVNVEFDEYIDGHSGHYGEGRKEGHCWLIDSKYLSLVDEEAATAAPKSPNDYQHDLFSVRDIVMTLIGDIEPYGDTRIDEERYKNLNKLVDLVTDLILSMAEVAAYRTRPEESISQIGTLAYDNLLDIKTTVENKFSR